MKTLLIDGDIVVYRASFAAQKRITEVELPNGSIQKFLSRAEAKEWLQSTQHSLDDVEMTYSTSLEPVGVALNAADAIIKKIIKGTGVLDYKLYIEGAGNYRDDLAVTHSYKGNRKQEDRPYHLQSVRDHLIKRWHAELVLGIETDDRLGIMQDDEDTCIVSIDKDLNMIRGWHYDFVKEDKYYVHQHEGDRWFLSQLLTGDSTDNIIGLKGVGVKTAAKILDKVDPEGDWGLYYRKCLTIILKKYNEFFGEEQGLARLKENASLLYILQANGEFWNYEDYI